MSKIGKKPIDIPEGVKIEIDRENGFISIKGPLGMIKLAILKYVDIEEDKNCLILSIADDSKQAKSNWGTMRSLIMNAVIGVTKGFEKTLILDGVGYKVIKDGENLVLSLGFSHPVIVKKVEEISFEVEKNTILKIKGINKMIVGEIAAKIRAMKKPEPYKGKGFHYLGEVIRRKAGKKAATSK